MTHDINFPPNKALTHDNIVPAPAQQDNIIFAFLRRFRRRRLRPSGQSNA